MRATSRRAAEPALGRRYHYIRLGGFLYLAVVLDASAVARRLSMGTTLATQLVLDALNMALAARRPNGVIHHSDQGSQ